MSIKRSSKKPSELTKKRSRAKKPSASSRSLTTSRQKQRGKAVASDAATTAPAGTLSEETRAQLEELQRRFEKLQEPLLLTDIQNEVGDIETALSLLPAEIEELRTRGYVFRNFLENKAQVLTEQWEELHDRVSLEIAQRVRELEQEADLAGSALRQATGGQASQVARAEAEIRALEHKANAAHSAVQAMYETLQQNVNQTCSQVKQIRWLLDQADEASFQLHPAEDLVMACQAQYLERGKEGPEGVLYLTDERLIFEQKEEVATKKVLFITTEKETVQQLIFAVPVGQIEEVKTSQKGFLGHKEMMELIFAPEADLSGATLRLRGVDNEEIAGLIGRVKSGEITRERTQPKDEAAIEAARSAPTKCPTCGATLAVEIVRGMREITCQYCGSVIRL